MIGTGSSLVLLPTLSLTLPPLIGDSELALRLAAGTTMAAMAVGAVTAAWTQARAGHLDTTLMRYCLIPYFGGALLGPWLAGWLPGQALKVYIGLVLAAVALRLLRPPKLSASRGALDYRHRRGELMLVLFVIALAASIAGIASGLFAIPYLSARYRLPLRVVIGTSTAAAAFYSLFGSLGHISAGLFAGGLPELSLGYVYLPALLPLALASALFAPLGVRCAGRVDERWLKRGFAGFLLCAAAAILLL